MKKFLSMALAVLMLVSLAACGSPAVTPTPAADNSPAPVSAAPANTAEPVTIRLFTNLPDRSNGQGLIEQMLLDQYIAENPHVTVELETLDDESYRTKFKAYAAGSEMPDLVSIWGHPGFIDEVIAAGLLAELDQSTYADYQFNDGALNSFTRGGKLYGMPRNTDVMGYYYNKAMFDANGWAVPETYEDMLALADEIAATGMIPLAMPGADKWVLCNYLTDLMIKSNGPGSMNVMLDAIAQKDWTDPYLMMGAKALQDTANSSLFQRGFETSDYATALNLFSNGQAAMFYMGSWAMSLATNEDVPAEVRDNIRVFAMPVIDGGRGLRTDIAAWNGGGYAVTEDSKVKDEATALLNYMFVPENWNRLAWENNVCMSAQDFSQYKTGNETPVQLEFMEIVTSSTNISGTAIAGLSTAEYQTHTNDNVQALAINALTPEQFAQAQADAS